MVSIEVVASAPVAMAMFVAVASNCCRCDNFLATVDSAAGFLASLLFLSCCGVLSGLLAAFTNVPATFVASSVAHLLTALEVLIGAVAAFASLVY